MRNIYYLIIFLSFNIFAQAPAIDNTFNTLETGVYQQDIGRFGVLLPNNKILSVFQDAVTDVCEIKLLNPDGNIDASFNSIDSRSTTSNNITQIFAKSDGQFLVMYYDLTIKMFNADGMLNANFISPILTTSSPYGLSISDVVFQDDGKIIIIGNFNTVNGVGYTQIVRLNNNGSIDTAFSASPGISVINKVVIQSDGKYLVGGYSTTSNSQTIGKIVRLNNTGSIDVTFNVNTVVGSWGVTSGFNNRINDIKIQPDGKIVVVGGDFLVSGSTVCRQIARLNTNGTRDTNFTYNQAYTNYFAKVQIQANGKILFNNDSTIKRLNSNGSVDNTFNYANTMQCSDREGAMFNQGTKLIVIGNFIDINGLTRVGIHRVNSNGSIDLTFNPHSGANSFYHGDGLLKAKVLLDQKILFIGNFSSYNDIACKNICRLTQNGNYDPSFQLDPAVKITPENNIRNKMILQQTDGKILLSLNSAYYSWTSINNVSKDIIRLNYDGSLDNTFNFSLTSCALIDIKLLNDGKFIAVGGANIFKDNNNKYKVIRFNANGSVDTGFNSMLFYHRPTSIDVQTDNKILISFEEDNFSPEYRPFLRLNADGTQDLSFNIYDNGSKRGSYIKCLNDGKFLITYNLPYTFYNYSYIGRLNSDGSVDPTFNIYTNTMQYGYGYGHPRIKIIENGNIVAFATHVENGGIYSRLIILSPDGVFLNSFANDSSNEFDIQNCSDIIWDGNFNKIDNITKNNIVRYKLSANGPTPAPTGSIYQTYSNGQTLNDLTVTGTNIQWYDTQTCSINNNTTNKNLYNIESLLPSSTLLVDGTTYYASQTINNIESNYRLPVTVYQPLGINDYVFDKLNIYPNPVQDLVTISNNSVIENLEIFNIIGQIIFSKKYNSNEVQLDFSNYEKGIYLAKIYSESKSITTKIIKK